MSNLLQILNLPSLMFCAMQMIDPHLKNSSDTEIQTYQLNNYYLLYKNIHFSISVFFLTLSQSSYLINRFLKFTKLAKMELHLFSCEALNSVM